jgi:hypothetical protein
VVVLQETAQSLLAAYFTITGTHPLFSRWEKQNIFLSLMVSLSMVVLHERRDRVWSKYSKHLVAWASVAAEVGQVKLPEASPSRLALNSLRKPTILS